MEQSVDIMDLLLKFLDDDLSPRERQQLDEWRAASPANEAEYQNLADMEKFSVLSEEEAAKSRIWRKLEQQFPELTIRRPKYWKYKWLIIVAAVILFIGGILWFNNQRISKNSVKFLKERNKTNTDSVTRATAPIILPAVVKATMIFPTGEKVDIKGIKQTDEEFEWEGDIANAGGFFHMAHLIDSIRTSLLLSHAPAPYVELTTPPGGTFNIEIFPGIIVYMNANSELKFPLMLTNRYADINMKGEIFFRVKPKTRKQPVYIQCNTPSSSVRLYAGKLNINASVVRNLTSYSISEGKLIFTHPATQQSIPVNGTANFTIDANARTVTANKADTTETFAWKNKLFVFNNTSIDEVMYQCSDWYNVNIHFNDDQIKSQTISGKFSRELTLNQLIEKLQHAAKIKCAIEKNTLIIERMDN